MQLLRHIRFAQVQQNNQIISNLQNKTTVGLKIEATTRLAAIQLTSSGIETCLNLKPVAISPEKVFASTEEAQMANFRKLLDLQPTWHNSFRISLLVVEETKSWIKRSDQAMLRQICFTIALLRSLTLHQ